MLAYCFCKGGGCTCLQSKAYTESLFPRRAHALCLGCQQLRGRRAGAACGRVMDVSANMKSFSKLLAHLTRAMTCHDLHSKSQASLVLSSLSAMLPFRAPVAGLKLAPWAARRFAPSWATVDPETMSATRPAEGMNLCPRPQKFLLSFKLTSYITYIYRYSLHLILYYFKFYLIILCVNSVSHC